MRRIQLDNQAFEGANNVYLFEGEGPTTLVDTGDGHDQTRRELRAALAESDLDFEDVEQVLLTHFHHDHAGLAAEIQAAGGARVHAHEDDAPLIAGEEAAIEEALERQRARFEQWGMPEEERTRLLEGLESNYRSDEDRPDVEPFEGGDRFEAGDAVLEAVELPGHSAGQSGFETDGELFSGDALLPQYTPNVGGADLRVDDALAKYLDALVRIAEGDYDRAYPGHREVIEDPAGRAREIFEHHRERTDRVVEAVADAEPADAWTVSAALFGDLEGIHVLHGPGEAYAHLEHLKNHGVVDRVDGGYVIVDEDRDLDELFPEFPER